MLTDLVEWDSRWPARAVPDIDFSWTPRDHGRRSMKPLLLKGLGFERIESHLTVTQILPG
jgi:hypothetical protein